MLQIRSRSDGGKYLKGCGTTAWNNREDVCRSDGGKYLKGSGTAAWNIICSQHLCMRVRLQCNVVKRVNKVFFIFKLIFIFQEVS